MATKFHLSVSPHIHSGKTTRGIMADVLIALLPATVMGVILFGLTSLAVIGVCIATCVLGEFLFNYIVKKEQTIGDLSAVVTGLLLALNLPANIPLWQAAVGSLFAIIIVKCIFGGIGCNLVNPAITARVFMLMAFSPTMTKAAFPVDVTSSATPLVELAEGKALSLMDLFLGKNGGAIGETCVLALVIGFIYLLVRKVITWHTPVAFVLVTFLFSFAVKGDLMEAVAWILSGGLFIGAIFMATDYTTSPSSPWGKIIFGVGCGILTVLIRFWGIYPEGVSYAILIMNILNPYIEKWTAPKVFGGVE